MTLSPRIREKQRQRHEIKANTAQAQTRATEVYLDTCCGHGEKRHALGEGIQLFVNLTRVRMLAYESATADLMDDLSFSQPRSTYLDRQLEVTTHIANSIKSITVQTTIDDIVDQVCREYQVDMSTGKRHANVIRHLIFAAVGWSTMLYTATYKAEDADFTTTETTIEGSSTVSSAKQHVAHSSKRPIGAVLRNLGLIPIACPPRPGSSQGLPSLLAVTHLNFFSLARLGDVKITWTDDLAKHCDFDRYGRKKELKLFRLPSFCASICLSESNETLLGR